VWSITVGASSIGKDTGLQVSERSRVLYLLYLSA
jgi:hypothetical protein